MVTTIRDICNRYGFAQGVICTSCDSVILSYKEIAIMDHPLSSRHSTLDESLGCCDRPFTLYLTNRHNLFQWHGGLRNVKGNLMVMGLEWRKTCL